MRSPSQVQDGVLDSADVLVHRHPCVRLHRIERGLVVVRVGVAHVVPARARERVHGVRLTTRGRTAHRAGGGDEALVRGERLAGCQVDVLGQAHRKLVDGHRHHAAMIAVDGGDGVAPVALTGDEPVAQAELHLATAHAALLEVGHDGRFALGVLTAGHAGGRRAPAPRRNDRSGRRGWGCPSSADGR